MNNTTITLKEHLEARAAETAAWVAEDPENRFAASYTVDIDHWNEMGIYTVEQFELYSAKAEYYDLYKSVHGHRSGSRWVWGDDVTLETVKSELEFLYEEAKREAEYEAKREKEAIEAFENEITRFIEVGAGDRETALRWWVQANVTPEENDAHGYDVKYICWCHNLPYEFANELKIAMDAVFSEPDVTSPHENPIGGLK
jgi:hypothetical protein